MGNSGQIVPSPNPAPAGSGLAAITALAPDNIWAVGTGGAGNNYEHTLVEHWNGQIWSIAPSPNSEPYNSFLRAVVARTPDDVWAAGYYVTGAQNSAALIEHWDGTTWRIASSPDPGAESPLYGLASDGAGGMWAAGYVRGANFLQTLIMHGYGFCTTPTPTAVPPSPSATATPPLGSTATSTSTPARTATPTTPPANTATPTPPLGSTITATPPPSPTPTATATVCSINFSDVHPADYFYTPVLYLACHGVISGYNGGMFRPYANTTRSQMVKIVVLGFNKAIVTPGGSAYSFTDVPRSNPFFPVVETAYADGIVSGYTCGVAVAGPCDSAHRPYFLPYANVTRSQLSKIDVIAAGWTLYDPATATFADVAHGSTFYQVVETAVCHGVISGYADHTFRPFTNATRGQISKIVYLSIVNPPVSCGP